MDSLYTTKTDSGWEARIGGVDGVVGMGDTELDAVKSLARGLRNKMLEAIVGTPMPVSGQATE